MLSWDGHENSFIIAGPGQTRYTFYSYAVISGFYIKSV